MIELRWGPTYPPTGKRGIIMGSDAQQYELVLQYRDTAYFPAGPWQDVPVVNIPSAADGVKTKEK